MMSEKNTCKTCKDWRSSGWYCVKHDAPQGEDGEYDCHSDNPKLKKLVENAVPSSSIKHKKR